MCVLNVSFGSKVIPRAFGCVSMCSTVLFIGETIRNMFGCGCYFVSECYGVVLCDWRCSIGYTVYGLPKSVCVVPVIPMSV